MKPEELLCKVLYLDGTVTNELLAGKKVIAIVVGDTLISLKKPNSDELSRGGTAM